MEHINWTYEGNAYATNTPYGKAVIIKRHNVPGGARVIGGSPETYIPQLVQSSGDVEVLGQFDDFETAEACLLGHLMDLDQPAGAIQNLEKLNETLALCERSLPPDSHPSHYARLHFIKQVLGGGDEAEYEATPGGPPAPELNWVEQGSEYRAATTHGTAVVAETRNVPAQSHTIGRAFTYTPRLEHPSGTVIRGYTTAQFEEAEAWIQTKLLELDHPTGGEADLDNLLFTLDVCEEALPPEAEMIHYVRLDFIKVR